MSKDERISNAVIRRLPKYRRYLYELKKIGVEKVSSAEISRMMGFTASQIRQDLNNFGGFGQQGYGYKVDELYEGVVRVIGLDRKYKMVIVGAGNLGQAIAGYTRFYKQGFIVDSMFDINPRLVGMSINDVPVRDCDELAERISQQGIDIGIICTPSEIAQDIATIMCDAGIKGIWNFAPVHLEVPDNVPIESIHLSDSLHSLVYYMNREKD